MPRIYITEPNHFYTFELPTAPGAEVLIGTAPHCQLALPGVGGLGEVHACISCQPQGYVITDLGSPTGTFANGVPIRSEYVMPGVEYRLGAAVITLAAEGAPAQQAMPQQAPAQQAAAPAPQPAAAAAAPHAAPKKKASPLKTGAAASKATKLGKKDLGNLAAKFDRSRGKNASKATFIYVVALLIVAFYAGIALHHWERTGNCLPGLVADETEAPAPAKVHTAPAAEETAQPETDTAEDTSSEDEPTATDDDTPAADDTTAEDETPTADETPTEDETTAEEETTTDEAESTDTDDASDSDATEDNEEPADDDSPADE